MEDQNKTYLLILLDSLAKKNTVLESLLSLTNDQRALLEIDEELDMDQFKEIMEQKTVMLKELGRLDQGFELIYENVKDVIVSHKQQYETEIKQLQSMIAKITDKSVRLESMEQENKRKIELFFVQKRTQIKNFKMSNKTVANYYKNMSGHTSDSSYFMDKRK